MYRFQVDTSRSSKPMLDLLNHLDDNLSMFVQALNGFPAVPEHLLCCLGVVAVCLPIKAKLLPCNASLGINDVPLGLPEA